jgi:hypothetical protein
MHGSFTEFALYTYADKKLFHCVGKNITVSANLLNFPLQMQHLDSAGQFCGLSTV